MTTRTLAAAAVEALRRRLRGELLQPGDDNHDAARQVWNGMIDRLVALKRKYDPTNVFRPNQNVDPGA